MYGRGSGAEHSRGSGAEHFWDPRPEASSTVSSSLRPPSGARDLLPREVQRREKLEAQLTRVFRRHGYQRIITPTLERLETLLAGGSIRAESVLQLRDGEGTMLGLRPEFTASIVRAAATRLAGGPLPLRLYYHGSVFRNSRREEGSYSSQEFFQSGVELIGAGGWLADAEILLLLADCIRSVGISSCEFSWTLLLGDVSLTESLLSAVAPTAQAAVRRAIAQLDYVYLESAPLPEAARQIGLQILGLRGQPGSVLSDLAQLPVPPERLRDLRQLCQVLEEHGVRVVLDLSLLQTLAYYTGIVFQAVASGEIIALGGRYDRLYALYSPQQVEQPGIGFTLLPDTLLRLLPPDPQTEEMGCKRLVVPLVPAGIPAALALAARWREECTAPLTRTEAVELELLDRAPEEIEAYARQCRIPEIAWVQADGSYHITHPG
ncbi:ATP phosphoribosyltransferase regulatory subunit [Synechococcus sp. JA-2-3B'a(2-13)]|uniref:ATP phosphoribosyltransferase regulatory subunit n=1 Tax=Synechococcus sp. (strain JA-2-3B'a(2-13)) TaxID=321332 RepID=HISZ_SYNJB|nr:ATP phosphoribosyltransferase regulatory subunit [Synechococcus sp. JA-2-3B'a(2-13)]Q2JMG5.1 RecName: Full=ATP phosphoribosyltransferase regulatory subunit [Synechococcus sp. JA-2-3B'a(2-13)]ABD02076.1 ATP phosphoribosyltransferase regulatory subunit [Synechococcus sp. JA-2-3B'a(2-13)]